MAKQLAAVVCFAFTTQDHCVGANMSDYSEHNVNAYYYNNFGVDAHTYEYWYYYVVPAVVITLGVSGIYVWVKNSKLNNSPEDEPDFSRRRSTRKHKIKLTRIYPTTTEPETSDTVIPVAQGGGDDTKEKQQNTRWATPSNSARHLNDGRSASGSSADTKDGSESNGSDDGLQGDGIQQASVRRHAVTVRRETSMQEF